MDADEILAKSAISFRLALTISAFAALAWAYSLELLFRVYITFKRRRGLYFFSLQIAAVGTCLHALAFVLKFYWVTTNEILLCTIITIGWYCMVTGQSLVLYSRLHIILHDQRRLRWVLYMISADVVLFHLPTTVFTYGSNLSDAPIWANGMTVIEKVQMTAFSIQEFIISGLYIRETQKILKPHEIFQKRRVRDVMRHLFYVQVLIIVLDIALLACEYANLYVVEASMKPAIYAFKLHMEFPILNQLTTILASNEHSLFQPSSHRGDNLQLGASMAHGSRNHPSICTKSDGNPKLDDCGHIRATMEVTVHTSDAEEHPESFNSATTNTTCAREGPFSPLGQSLRGYRTRSFSSSEIELAKAGATPTL